jgi:hypothetical protein
MPVFNARKTPVKSATDSKGDLRTMPLMLPTTGSFTETMHSRRNKTLPDSGAEQTIGR